MGDDQFKLPPGFRFDPTDEELVVHFLQRKAALLPFHPDVIPDLHLYPYDPWELDGKALREGNKWYFYSRRTQNRVTSNGYWKALGVEEPVITRSSCNSTHKVGMKRYLAFYQEMELLLLLLPPQQDHPKEEGISKQLIMNLVDTFSVESTSVMKMTTTTTDGTELSCLDEVFLSLDDLDEISLPI
ncbi:hypothetical protein L3X38_009022 [Prunus dulcis]|uniref:NAC domain-containing protein n=1 Tax=Prunus dulcis TaxID=3755 RepID=A0AAD4ZXL8_PRUDU|nr:hypothetical protein L3X38_009022 [Prunus dulcis]